MEKKAFTCNQANLQHHLFNAHINWLREEGDDPYIEVDATWPGVDVPEHVVKDGKVTLNLAVRATQYVNIEKDAIFMGCRFSGRHYDVVIPNGAVRVIFGHHSKVGVQFPEPKERPLMASMIRTPASEAKKAGNGSTRANPLSVVK
jgi:stringent starvation protein B